MECKDLLSRALACRAVDLIDTLWNVKEQPDEILDWLDGDLIDTLWNVKAFSTVSTAALFMDLIDTLWNVKANIAPPPEFISNGFNRYIVECKGVFDSQHSRIIYGFNRYIVECKGKYCSAARIYLERI